MSFSIIISDLIVNAHIGIFDWEQKTTQRLKINARIVLSNDVDPAQDKIEETVDYNEIVQAIRHLAAETSFRLLETFAQSAMQILLKDPRTQSATIRIEKLDRYENAGGVGIEFTQSRQ